ncbi:MAG: hypothetical protein FWD68_10825 [Alphaproteobacteria bacterium]|nr:hypothetical protein [Alphaproteobacteria bacterium]
MGADHNERRFAPGPEGSLRGADVQYAINFTLHDAFTGKTVQIEIPALVACPTCSATGNAAGDPRVRCPSCSGQGRVTGLRSFSVEIPRGIDDGAKIRIGGEGESGIRGAPAGDFLLLVKLAPHHVFQRSGADLYCRVRILKEFATPGRQFEVAAIDSGRVTVTIPPDFKSGQRLRIPEKGMPIPNSIQTGDMYVEVIF